MFSAKRPQFRRLIAIDRELRTRKYPSAQQLAEINETNEKTIREDLKYLRYDMGAPIEYCAKARGWYYTSPTFQLPQLTMTEGELVALFLAEQMLRQHKGTPYEAELTRAVQKLTAMLPDEVSIQPKSLAATYSFRSSVVVSLADIELFRKLSSAVISHQQIELRYYTASRDAESTRIVDPWHLTCVDGFWYLIGFCHTRQKRLMFAPSRIRDFKVTGKSITPPDDFRIGDYLGESFKVIREDDQPLQLVRLRFAASATRYIREKVWHPSQHLEVHEDGSSTLELSIRSLLEIRRWIMSWGSECEVLEPTSLRDEICLEASKIADQLRPPITSPALVLGARTNRIRSSRRQSSTKE